MEERTTLKERTKKILYIDDEAAHRTLVGKYVSSLIPQLSIDTASSFPEALGKVGVPGEMMGSIIDSESIDKTKELLLGKKQVLSLGKFKEYDGFLVDNDITGELEASKGKGRHLAKLFSALNQIAEREDMPRIILFTNSLLTEVFPGEDPEEGMKRYGITDYIKKLTSFGTLVEKLKEIHSL